MAENNNNDRVSELERHAAATSTDIRGIYAGLDEIRDVLVRIQENAKPNLGGLFVVLLATCTFLVTIGGLTMAPVFRELARINEVQTVSSNILMERTGVIGRIEAEVNHIQIELDQQEQASIERHGAQAGRMDRMQTQMDLLKVMAIDAQNRASRLEGALAPNWNQLMEKN